MNEIDNYERNTSKLKALFTKADNSGKLAWEIGELLLESHDKKLYRNNYPSFDQYTQAEFEKSAQTALGYIEIRKRFEWSDLTDNLLVTHLKTIASFENSTIGNIVLKAMKSLEKNRDIKNQSISSKGNLSPSNKDISLTLQLLENASNISEDKAISILKGVVEESKKSTSRKRQKKTKEDKFGRKLSAKGIPEIEDFFENEPIDEMGTVALFCILFPLIKDLEFKLGKDTLQFDSIQYVRTAFPDSSIRVKELDPKSPKYKFLKIEFEFDSYNFIKHGHLKDPKIEECNLIICWKDTIEEHKVIHDKMKESLPGIISISDILESGQISVKNYLKEEMAIFY